MASQTCNGALKHLVDYLDGELSAAEQDDLEAHFADCDQCMRFLKTYRSTGPVCKKAIERQMPAGMKQSLFDFLRSETNSEP